ncbi:mitogen-activated protein kinase kinase kinase 9 [Fistulifera solaris]|uniref:Mitogen-activated protein kinase kinase kinase 9 n=1 Tax=Fistulifera solaris TaxID=1519565 RepID=A0A1Z5JGM1_FISSO|nr:mitogen-activated protein kinase kinase kinase 9 [Fistulifera solaris]|eukprot:GAX13150.1 mitogen-activated protein kinase kinase kinase 9 [Fistulifera solaris]
MKERNEAAAIDTVVLRKILRLVYCLQKERGASCAFRAHPARKLSVLVPARRDTDQAMLRLKDNLDSTASHVLGKIRSTLPLEALPSTCGFHKLLLSYNTLIQYVHHEYILKFTSSQRSLHKQSNLSFKSLQKKDSFGSRVSSYQHLANLSQTTPNEMAVCGNRRPTRIRSLSYDAIHQDRFVNLVFQEDLEMRGWFGHRLDDVPSTTPVVEETQENNILQLVNLLDVFVRLKEAAGMERATLSSILAAEDAESRMLMNDLVLTAENQRSQQEELNQLPEGTLHDLVREAITMPPQMQQLQRAILNGLELGQLRSQYNENKLWNLTSLYVNKLHSMELLLVEEIEHCTVLSDVDCTAVKNNIGNSSRMNNVLDLAFNVISHEKLKGVIESLSPEEVKGRLLSALSGQAPDEKSTEQNRQNGVKVGVENIAKGVDGLLQEISKAPASKEWEINLYEVHFKKRIGQGAAGTTYLARWSGLDVAVKVASITEMGLDGWRKEVQALQKLHHPNIIRLLGSVYHPSPLTFCLVLEYCDGGDLSVALQKCTPRNFFFHVASSISKGMSYLHNKGIIHRDIKPGNILLDGMVSSGNFSVKITDFGVATESNNGGDQDPTAETGTYRWMPPEVIRHETYSQTADVYSSAILFWQLLSRESPFANMSQIEAAAAVAMNDARPPFPSGVPGSIQSFIEKCWTRDPDRRPSFDQILEELEVISHSLTEEQLRWIECPIGHPVYQESAKERPAYPKLELPSIHEANNLKVPKRRGIKALFSRKSVHF